MFLANGVGFSIANCVAFLPVTVRSVLLMNSLARRSGVSTGRRVARAQARPRAGFRGRGRGRAQARVRFRGRAEAWARDPKVLRYYSHKWGERLRVVNIGLP